VSERPGQREVAAQTAAVEVGVIGAGGVAQGECVGREAGAAGAGGDQRDDRCSPLLTSHEVIVQTIAATTHPHRLKVHAQLDTNSYSNGVKVAGRQMKAPRSPDTTSTAPELHPGSTPLHPAPYSTD
jgi:hypothetical protein